VEFERQLYGAYTCVKRSGRNDGASVSS
jgi:hypothetical protein